MLDITNTNTGPKYVRASFHKFIHGLNITTTWEEIFKIIQICKENVWESINGIITKHSCLMMQTYVGGNSRRLE